MKMLLFSITLNLFSSLASAEVAVCNLKKIIKNENGSTIVTQCQFIIDSADKSGSPGNGGISQKVSAGSISSDCTDFPSDYDFKTGELKKFQMWDQGAQTPDDMKNMFEFMKSWGYFDNGDLGFDPAQVSKAEWIAGGFSLVTNLYVLSDKQGKKLGMVLVPGGFSPVMSFLGCYLK